MRPCTRGPIPISDWSNVDLPAPLSPCNTTSSPSSTCRRTSNRACAWTHQAFRPSTASIGQTPFSKVCVKVLTEVAFAHLRVMGHGLGGAVGHQGALHQHQHAVGHA